ncbi:MAG: hypothetical protein NUW02_02555 [Candidatus Campbellbacteria bacterium]|nr:hypothetical protein [Candidatus Campbellbacteria bacterium]
MKKLGMFLVALCITGAAQAQPKYPLVSVADVVTSTGEVRCGDFFVFTRSTPQGPSVMFRYSAGGRVFLKVVALSHVTLTVDATATIPLVVMASVDNEVSSANFQMSNEQMGEAKKCFPPPATVLLSP